MSPRIVLALLCGAAVVACDDPPGTEDGGVVVVPEDGGAVDGAADGGARDASSAPDSGVTTPDSGPAPDAAPPPDLIELGLGRELRGVWVATVSNIDFPRNARLTPAEATADLEAIVARTATAGLNAIFFQVRPESDALYTSRIEPWSRFLTGTQGRDPGYDPLATLIALARARRIEVHAWINPYRGLTSAGVNAAANHVTRTLSAHAIRYGDGVVMDPGAPEVRAHVVSVVRELLTDYELDGVHFDDYFYPYPDANGTPFGDGDTYDAYVAGGGAMSLGDWRRDNVNTLVREVHEVVVAVRPSARFGISPFGIYRNNVPPGIRGLDAYATIYCDALAWMDAGWVDYLAPQLYWPTTQAAQSYTTLSAWWASTSTGGRHIFPGHSIARLGSSAAWTVDEMRLQVETTRALHDQGAQGDLFFSYRQMAADLEGVFRLFQRELYPTPAIPPPVPRALPIPAPPTLTAMTGAFEIAHPARAGLAGLVVYRQTLGAWAFERVVDRDATRVNAEPGVWAVAALGPGSVESGARIVEVLR